MFSLKLRRVIDRAWLFTSWLEFAGRSARATQATQGREDPEPGVVLWFTD
jgi:hypothetical protein